MALVDTDVLIDMLRDHPPTVEWLANLVEEPEVPGFVAMELYNGCHSKKEADGVTKMLREFSIVWPSPAECDNAQRYFAVLKLSHNLGMMDALIAACAVERSATLYTFNIKHFRPYPGLTVEPPYSKS
jgi:predicted nucleic acid-binding protein